MHQINWGIIGPGSIADAFAYSIQATKNSKLISVLGRDSKKVNSFAQKFHINAHYQLDDFISSEEIDAIYIATPHSEHFFYAIEAIKNGKHVLCEKPLTMNAHESMILLALANEKNIFLMEAFMYRVHPQTRNILDNLDFLKDAQDKIMIEASFGFQADVPESHRLRNPELGGGAILDVGCYPLTMSKLIAGHLQDLSYADPESLSAIGQLDETGVDLQTYAHLIFSDSIEAKISCAINENFSNNLIISSGKYTISVPDPWHCGQFQEGNSSIYLSHNGQNRKEIKCMDDVGLFAREIEHAAKCILESKIESKFIDHAETQSNMFWLDKWRQEMKIDCPRSRIKNSPIFQSKAYLFQETKLESHELPGLSKTGSRLALGCDNQTSDLHAFTMFDHFYGSGGRIFDTAFIYNHGMGDKYLGDWINARRVREDVIVLGKGAHTPHCEPQHIRPQVLQSLERLQTSKLDIYCLHRDNPDIPVEEFIDALAEIKSEGLVDLIGASNWEMDRFSKARNYAIKNSKEPFTVLSNNFSLAEMIKPVWPGCVGINDQYLKYLIEEKIILFPWSSQARGFFLKKKEIISNEHFSNPTLDEEMRVWHYEKNLQRRQICFELAKERNVQPIQIALAYVLHKSKLIFPLIGPRTIFESNSSIQATQLKLTTRELQALAQD
jgi:aryl-alcohol dehydrogenase-like predicted oxidoreductase/predicted dehydrogenase|tara:strand:- start:5348 stop:7351 length:2004 start_codon:yes stop_codon:yes gene_type:complete